MGQLFQGGAEGFGVNDAELALTLRPESGNMGGGMKMKSKRCREHLQAGSARHIPNPWIETEQMRRTFRKRERRMKQQEEGWWNRAIKPEESRH